MKHQSHQIQKTERNETPKSPIHRKVLNGQDFSVPVESKNVQQVRICGLKVNANRESWSGWLFYCVPKFQEYEEYEVWRWACRHEYSWKYTLSLLPIHISRVKRFNFYSTRVSPQSLRHLLSRSKLERRHLLSVRQKSRLIHESISAAPITFACSIASS